MIPPIKDVMVVFAKDMTVERKRVVGEHKILFESAFLNNSLWIIRLGL